jgi:hypothetical protein
MGQTGRELAEAIGCFDQAQQRYLEGERRLAVESSRQVFLARQED